MQHSVKSVSLASDRGPARRSSRHSAAAEQAPRRGPGRRPGGRYFTVEEPPPLEAPKGIAEITGWELAAAMWRDHLPEQLLGVDCASCKQSWPCDAWELADGLLTQCCDSAGEVEHQT